MEVFEVAMTKDGELRVGKSTCVCGEPVDKIEKTDDGRQIGLCKQCAGAFKKNIKAAALDPE